MLQFFRNIAKSKIGLAFLMGFVVLLMLSFAAGDISNFGFGGGASSTEAATVGDDTITTAEVQNAARNALESARAENPALTMKAFLEGDTLDELVNGMIDRSAILAIGREWGIVASEQQITTALQRMGAFRGADGNFDEAAYRAAIQKRGLTDARVREGLAAQLVARQIFGPTLLGNQFPQEMAQRYATIQRERRIGGIALLPSAAFAPRATPSETELQAFYTRNRARYERPERRVIRYATFGEAAIKDVPVPTEAQIAARYEANRAQYAASETRDVVQLIVPTEPAAQAILAEVRGGKTLEQAATGKGLSTAELDGLTREALSGQSSSAVAEATFTAARGAIAGPVRSGLGWHLMRIESVTSKPGRSLAQVRGELSEALAAENRRRALNDFTAEIEDEFSSGGSLGDVAQQLGLTISETPALTADGGVFGMPGVTGPPVLQGAIDAAFAMEKEAEPQIAEIERGKTFLVFEVKSIAPAAAPPLAEVRAQVLVEYGLEQGAGRAKASAERLAAALRRGDDPAAAFAALGMPQLPPLDRIEMSREELTARLQSRQPIAPPLRLLFTMAEGTARLLPGPRNRGWYVVWVKDIIPGQVPAGDRLIASAQDELRRSMGSELQAQLRRAIREEVGVERNEEALRTLSRALIGGN